jgi:hypothetical protein
MKRLEKKNYLSQNLSVLFSGMMNEVTPLPSSYCSIFVFVEIKKKVFFIYLFIFSTLFRIFYLFISQFFVI